MNPTRRSSQIEHKYSAVVGKWEQLWAQSNIYVERYVNNKYTVVLIMKPIAYDKPKAVNAEIACKNVPFAIKG